MDHPRIKIGALLCAIGFSACVAQKIEPNSSIHAKPYFSCTLQPATLLTMAEQFLEWQKGYPIKIRDHERGIVVTDWALESPTERHRLTLRIVPATQGSLISIHAEIQVLENQGWIELPSAGSRETQILTDLKEYLRNSPTLKNQKVSIYD